MGLEAIYNRNVDMKPHQLGIVVWPDDRLHVECEDVVQFDDDENKYLTQLALDMIYTMRVSGGIGLAAPQVAVPANMFVMTVDNKRNSIVLINPVIVSQSEDVFDWEEGCLSVPGYFEHRQRPNKVIIRFHDVLGKEHEMEFIGIWAFVAQHEMDHLRGKVFVDDLSFFKKSRVKTKIKKTLKQPKQ